MTTAKLVELIIGLADDKKAENILSLNISKKSSLTDYFVICEGTSDRQVQAIADNIVEGLKKKKVSPLRSEGIATGEWVILDYGEVIVHVFQPAMRQTYQLEELWKTTRKKKVETDQEVN